MGTCGCMLGVVPVAGWSCVVLRCRNVLPIGVFNHKQYVNWKSEAQVPRILLIKLVTRTFECELCNLNV